MASILETSPLSPNATMAIGGLLLLHVGALAFWAISVFIGERPAVAAERVRVKTQ